MTSLDGNLKNTRFDFHQYLGTGLSINSKFGMNVLNEVLLMLQCYQTPRYFVKVI